MKVIGQIEIGSASWHNGERRFGFARTNLRYFMLAVFVMQQAFIGFAIWASRPKLVK